VRWLAVIALLIAGFVTGATGWPALTAAYDWATGYVPLDVMFLIVSGVALAGLIELLIRYRRGVREDRAYRVAREHIEAATRAREEW
jgi:hypothetical protein